MGCASSKKNDNKSEVIKDPLFPGGKRSVPKLHLEKNPLLQKRKAFKESVLAQCGSEKSSWSNPASPPDSRNHSKEKILSPTLQRVNFKDAVKPEKMLEFTIDNEDSIGLRLSLVQSPPVVVAVDVGSQAESVGAQVGDYFFAVNGLPVGSMSQENLIATLRDKRPLNVGLVSCGSVHDEGLNGYGSDKDILSGLLSWVVVDGRVDGMLGESSVDGEQLQLVLQKLAGADTTGSIRDDHLEMAKTNGRHSQAKRGMHQILVVLSLMTIQLFIFMIVVINDTNGRFDLEQQDSLVISISRHDSSHEFDSVTVLAVFLFFLCCFFFFLIERGLHLM